MVGDPRGVSSTKLARAVARLDELVNWERRDRSRGMRVGLDSIRDILRRLGDPHLGFRAVHVAGTKGKGSTSALIAAGLQQAGFAVGLYTSPHVSSIGERVRIDGCDVDDDELAAAIERALGARDRAAIEATAGSEASWFDLLTSAAFLVFSERSLSWVVVECGLGGRLDSTNVVQGVVCVVTNIDLEHTAVLGNTKAAIAREKGGIVKPGSTLVTSLWPDPALPPDDDAGGVLAEIAARHGCPVLRPEQAAATMGGRNLELARLALDELGRRGVEGRLRVSSELLDAAAITAAHLPARMERFFLDGTLVVLDGAHVASSVRMVLEELAAAGGCAEQPVVVLALGRDKDAAAILKTLAPAADTVLCTTVASGPLAAAETLASQARQLGIPVLTETEPRAAFFRAVELAKGRRWVLVIGSFYLAGIVRDLLCPGPNPELKRPRC